MLSSGIGKHTCSLSASSVSHSVVRGFFQVQCFPALLPEENTHPLSHSLSHWCKSLSEEKRYYWHFRSLLAGRPHLSVSDTRERLRLRKTKRIWRERHYSHVHKRDDFAFCYEIILASTAQMFNPLLVFKVCTVCKATKNYFV